MRRQTELADAQDILQFFKAAGVEDALSEASFDALAAGARAPAPRDISPAPQRQAASMPSAPPASAAPVRQSAPAAPAMQTPPVSAASAALRPLSAPPIGQNRAAAENAPRRPSAPQTHIPYEEWLARARAQAASARNLAELKQNIAAFDGCALKFTAKNTCIADGSRPHDLMLVGEGPGAEEDRQALPFVGRAGQLLNLMLAAIGFSRESLQPQLYSAQAEAGGQIAAGGNTALPADALPAEAAPPCAYITNAVFWRPPGNRTPTAEEIALCRPFLERQIELARPKILLGLGGAAANALLGGKYSILRLRGKWHIYKTADGQEIPFMPSLHPAFLLRAPLQKKQAWQDLLAVKMRLRELSGDRAD